MERGDLNVDLLGRGYAWFDGGTPETMSAASQYVELIETVQGIRIACPEEVALRMGFIDETQFGKLIDKAGGSPYGAYLSSVLDDM